MEKEITKYNKVRYLFDFLKGNLLCRLPHPYLNEFKVNPGLPVAHNYPEQLVSQPSNHHREI